MNNPITMSCNPIDLEKQIVLRANRLMRVLKVICFHSTLKMDSRDLREKTLKEELSQIRFALLGGVKSWAIAIKGLDSAAAGERIPKEAGKDANGAVI